MTPRYALLLSLLLAAVSPAFPFSSGAVVMRAGVPTDDGGRTCTACHTTFAPANSDPRGKVSILLDKMTYNPGVKQTIRIRVEHPEAIRWGFQLTARPVSDTTQMAGSFTVNPTIRVRCTNTQDSPCGGGLEFAEHVAASTNPGKPDFNEWEIEWTPPGNEVGAVTLYAAGNAANNNGANTGDRIYTTSVTLTAEGSCSLTKKPSLKGIANAGSYATNLSPGVLGSLFGLDFSPGLTRSVGLGDLVDGAFPLQLNCIGVEIAGKRAPVTYVQQDQINFQVPFTTPTGPVQLIVIANPGKPNEVRSDVGTVTVNPYSPAFFTFNGKSIAALTADFKPIADPANVSGGVIPRRGDVILLYGTGFGPSEPVFQAGEIPPGQARLRDPFTISIGGITLTSADVQYAGLAPQLISGLVQFNVKIPQAVTPGSAVPVSITVGSVTTQTAGAVIPIL